MKRNPEMERMTSELLTEVDRSRIKVKTVIFDTDGQQYLMYYLINDTYKLLIAGTVHTHDLDLLLPESSISAQYCYSNSFYHHCNRQGTTSNTDGEYD